MAYRSLLFEWLSLVSVTNIAAKPLYWATFDPASRAQNWVPRFADPITVNVIQWAYRKLGYLRPMCAGFGGTPWFGQSLVANTEYRL